MAGFTGNLRVLADGLFAFFAGLRTRVVAEDNENLASSGNVGCNLRHDGSDRQHDHESPPPWGRAKRGQQTKGKGRGGIGTKFHLAITTAGQVAEGFLTGADVHDVSVAPELTADVVNCFVLADRGYDSDEYRNSLKGGNNTPVIPGRRNRRKPMSYDKRTYRQRGFIERIFGKLKENRRLTVRYEKTNLSFLSFIFIAVIKLTFDNSV